MRRRLPPLFALALLLALPSSAPARGTSPGGPSADSARNADGLASFKSWLDREHKGYGCDDGPGWFRNATVDAAYPGQRFCYVLTHARGIRPPFANGLSLVARVGADGTFSPLNAYAPATFQPGLIRVASAKQARRATAAVLILALGDPGQRRWPVDERLVRARRSRGGWLCTFAHGAAYYVSEVSFDARGMLTAIRCNTPPAP